MSRELLFSLTKKDFEFQAFRAGGKGGQHQNKNDTAMRCIHRPSGAVGESREFKSQHQNKQQAFKRMTKDPKFKLWVDRKCWDMLSEETLDQRVENAMADENLKVEVRDERGRWVEVDADQIYENE